jgi:tRNA(Ile)-lysidine synthase TilS/MesJ
MCKQCEINPVYEFTNKRKVCKNCFIVWFQKKVLYTIRKFSMINRGDVVSYKKDNNFRDIVLEDALKFYASKAPVEITKNNRKNVTKIAVSITSDILANEIINSLINGNLKSLREKPVEGKIIKPLFLFLDKEVLLYAKVKKLKFNKISNKENKIKNFINELEEKHLELKHAIVNSYLELYC